ncbi:MAG TPA: hypothetical protein VNV85_11700 [Puia sp.]|jgi:hypothetical protein|nr:hypothetical protein [Puia sp.]
MHSLTRISPVLIIGLALNYAQATAQAKIDVERVGRTVEAGSRDIDWEVFDTASTISRTFIKFKDIQGLWNAFRGAYRFDNIVNGMELTSPAIFEVKDDTYRRNVNKDFKEFILRGNLIIRSEQSKCDTGIINKITPTELTISWKNNSNYTRYYYKK